MVGLEQGHISPPSFSLAPVVQGEIRLECHTKDWPLASGRMLTAVCTDSWVTSHLWGWLGPGWREEGADQVSQLWSVEWDRMKKLLIKASWEIRGDGNSAGRAQAPVARWGEGTQLPEWALLFLLLLITGNIWSNWNQQFISQIGLMQWLSKLMSSRITWGSFWKYRSLGFSPKDSNCLGLR